MRACVGKRMGEEGKDERERKEEKGVGEEGGKERKKGELPVA